MCISYSDFFSKNKAWVESVKQDNPDFFQLASKQHNPDYLWLGCSDSRVPINEMLGILPGEIFVHRNIANQANGTDMSFSAVLEYAITQLKVKHILVVGHYACGGVSAAINGNKNEIVNFWVQDIVKLVSDKQTHSQANMSDEEWHDYICEQNVIKQVENINRIPLVKKAKEERGLGVAGWIYNVRDGLLHDITP